MDTFGNTIRQIRKSLGLTQLRVYELCGVSQETQRLLENDMREVGTDILEKLSLLYKTDLIRLRADTREITNIFSNEAITRLLDVFNEKDYDQLELMISEFNATMKETLCSGRNKRDAPMDFFYVINNVFHGTHFNTMDIIVLEKLLDSLSRTTGKRLSDTRLLDVEIGTAITLSVMYRQEGQFEKALETLRPCLDYVKTLKNPTTMQSRYIGSIYVNIAYVYHRMDKHQQVIDFIDECLSDSALALNLYARNDLLTRKGIAYHQMGKHTKAYDHFTAVLITETGRRKEVYSKVITEQYGVKHHLA